LDSLGPPAAAFPSLGDEPTPAQAENASFPSLGAAAKVKEPKKKSKGVKLSFAEFAETTGGGSSYAPPGRSGGGGGFGRAADNIVLPSGPRLDRGDDEFGGGGGGRLGGGFKEYGGDRGGGDRYGDRGGDRYGDRGGDRYGDRGGFGDRGGDRYGDRGGFGDRGGGRFDRDRDGEERPEREDLGPSRADMSSNWGSDRRAPPQDDRYASRGGYGDREERRGGFGDREERRGGFGDYADRPPREELGPSRADESDSWSRDRKQLPERDSRYDDRPPREERDWGSLRSRTSAAAPSDDFGSRGERPKLNLKPRSESADAAGANSQSSLFGGAKPVDVKYVEDKPREAIPAREERTERKQYDAPKDSDGDRWGRKPSFAPRKEEELREATPEERAARPKLNLQKRSTDAPVASSGSAQSSLFGGARPREEALKEAGRDWQAEDLKRSVGSVKRKEFKEEKELKEKIAEKRAAGEDVADLEKELTKLSLELDDKFRFAKNKPEGASKKSGETSGEAKDFNNKSRDADAEKSNKPRVVQAEASAPVTARNAFDALTDAE